MQFNIIFFILLFVFFSRYRMEGPQRIALVEPRTRRGLLPPPRVRENLLGGDLKF